MAWAGSSIFRAFVDDAVENTTAFDLSQAAADIPKVALYNNTGTPDNDATSALSAYNAATSPWVVANEVSQVGQWAAGGVAVSSIAMHGADTADNIWYDAADTASGTAATLLTVFGCLVYDDTLTTPVADQGICYNYFGGTQSVTSGQFTVVWHVNGIWRITVTQA